MLIVKRLNKFGVAHPGSVATLGVFDGIHLGHRAILDRLVRLARRRRHDSVVITFDPPPQAVLGPRGQARFLTSLQEKEAIFEKAGIDVLAVIKFSRAVAAMAAGDFVRRILVGQLRASHIICGSDCGFGRGRSGSLALLREMGRGCGFGVTEVRPLRLAGATISSTAIKLLISRGEVELAGRMLGRPYRIEGTVAKGQGIGRAIGYPTLNVRPGYRPKLLPRNGSYAAEARIGRRTHRGLLYVGTRPTVGRGLGPRVEFHALEGRPDPDAKNIVLQLYKYIRPEWRFSGLDQLRRAIGSDARAAARILKLPAKRLNPATI